MAEENRFNFEQFVVEQLKALNTKFDLLPSTFLTREEATLMKKERDDKLGTLDNAISQHSIQIAAMKTIDDKQQGGIDANRRTLNIFLTVLSILAVLTAGYVGVTLK